MMKLDSAKVDAIADAIGKLASRFDVMTSRRDEWSPEARNASAQARERNSPRKYPPSKPAGSAEGQAKELARKAAESRASKREDEWSPEAREAAAKSRGSGNSPKSLSEKKEEKNYERDLRPEHVKARAYGRS